jgi:uncharacterized integral membrane protein
MGLGKVVGLGIAFVILLIIAFFDVVGTMVAVAQGSVFGVPLTGSVLVGFVAGSLIWVVVAGVLGWLFIRAVRQYRGSRKPLQ